MTSVLLGGTVIGDGANLLHDQTLKLVEVGLGRLAGG
jgi:hypothetical protein